MPNHDETFMARALTLAEATAALASPNPQVGCVLVRMTPRQPDHRRRRPPLRPPRPRRDRRPQASRAAASARRRHRLRHPRTLQPPRPHPALRRRPHRRRHPPLRHRHRRPQPSGLRPRHRKTPRRRHRSHPRPPARPSPRAQRRLRPLHQAPAPLRHPQGRPLRRRQARPDPATARPPNQPLWLTGPAARAEVQLLRHASDAILTGIGTVLADDPLLTDRTAPPPPPPPPPRRPRHPPPHPLSVQAPPPRHERSPDLLQRRSSAPPAETRLHARSKRSFESHLPPLQDGRLPLHRHPRRPPPSATSSASSSKPAPPSTAPSSSKTSSTRSSSSTPNRLGPDAIPFAASARLPLHSSSSASRHLTSKPLGPDIRVTGLLHDPWPTLTALNCHRTVN